MSDVEIGVIYEECIEDEGMTQVPFNSLPTTLWE